MMTEQRMLASDPRYPIFNEFWQTNALAHNPALFMGEIDLSDVQINKAIDALEEGMRHLLDGMPTIFMAAMIQIAAEEEKQRLIEQSDKYGDSYYPDYPDDYPNKYD